MGASEFCLAKTIFAGMDMQFKLNFCKAEVDVAEVLQNQSF